jgi:hypothetical protein
MSRDNKKKSSTLILSQRVVLILAILLLSMAGCKKDTPLTAQETVTAMLTSTEAWQEPSVTVDGVDYSDLYKNFQIKFDESVYTSSGGAPVWAAAGTWVFINEEATLMKLDGTREVEIIVTDEFLELSFQWEENTFEPGRVNSVKGKQKFKLKKKP